MSDDADIAWVRPTSFGAARTGFQWSAWVTHETGPRFYAWRFLFSALTHAGFVIAWNTPRPDDTAIPMTRPEFLALVASVRADQALAGRPIVDLAIDLNAR